MQTTIPTRRESARNGKQTRETERKRKTGREVE
jgi:hypothetical protein